MFKRALAWLRWLLTATRLRYRASLLVDNVAERSFCPITSAFTFQYHSTDAP
jgi:hypothetical protein